MRRYTEYDGAPETGQDIYLAAAEHYLFTAQFTLTTSFLSPFAIQNVQKLIFRGA